MRHRAFGAVAILLLALGSLAWLRGTPDPIVSHAELRLRQIYDVARWARRVPVQLAIGAIAQSRAHEYVEELALPADVRRRVLARVESNDFVDELVPFLLAVKDLYAAPSPEGGEVPGFDAHLRASFDAASAIPGMEHSMFQFAPAEEEEEEGQGLPGLSADVAEQLVKFYDALYLRDHARARSVDERLVCGARSLDDGLREATLAATPSVRELLDVLGDSMEEGSEIADAIRGLRDDDARLESATASIIQFIDSFVCKQYRIFATRGHRAEQLSEWMRSELRKPGGGALWAFLEHVKSGRRYAALVVVDGLEGALMRALASGRPGDPFLREVVAERVRGPQSPPASPRRTTPPATQNRFLAHIARSGFAHPDYLPTFRKLFASDDAHLADVGISTTPTISVRNLPIAKTGAPVAGPGGTGIPNFHFVDREFFRNGERTGRPYYFFGNDAVLLDDLTEEEGMRTLYDRLPRLASFSCAAQYDAAAHYALDAFLNLGLGEKLRDFGERLCVTELERRADNLRRELGLIRAVESSRALLSTEFHWYQLYQRWGRREAEKLALRRLDELADLEQETLPELLLYYNPWPDHFAHFKGPFADEILAPSGELNRLDYWLGRLEAVYRDAGVEARTVFGMAGDHGLSPVFHLVKPEVEIFDALRERGHDFEVVKISSDEGEGPKLTNPFEPPSMKGIDVVVASTAGGNFMLDFFNDQGRGWAEQPLYRDLAEMRPLSASSDAPVLNIVEEIHTQLRDSLDYLVVRETPCSVGGGTVRLIGTRNGERAEAFVRREGDRLHYRYKGADLLDTDRLTPYEELDTEQRRVHGLLHRRCVEETDPDLPATWCNERQWRELSSYTPRPDAVVQIGHLYDTPRAGTVNLFPREGVGYNSLVPGRHAGESFHEKNAFVGLWGAALTSRREAPALRSAVNGSVPMAIYEYLSGERVQQGVDGWGYPSLGEVIFRADPLHISSPHRDPADPSDRHP